MAQVLKDNPRDSVAVEALWPLKEPFRQAWLDDLRQAGLPNE